MYKIPTRTVDAPETVYIIDDDEAVRDSLQWLIEPEGYQVITYEDPELFIEQFQWPCKAVLCLDIRMPKLSGLEVQDILNQKGITVPIIFITGHGDVNLAVETMKKGASDFLEKPFDEVKIKALIDSNMTKARELFELTKVSARIDSLYSKLTTRELQVLERIVAGRLNKQIADDLNISIKTVEAHRANIMDKLEVTTVADLLKIALRKAPDLT
ncbi:MULTISPECIES: response regulator transcription factor [Limnobacter]|uniref:DNA-binding response regulator n=1 Tax=Limnobacter litoralis TaxID=481366 RepID=A0ABQ5YME5_9BURK|nr:MULTISPECIES: response regulator [Limnobacter]GLR25764.1 DNA-binding response regulator [Limnobacter litoralis]HEX5486099.1 response regulator [Limnobacter sp.]